MPSGTQIASHAAPASQNGQTGSFNAGGATRASAAISRHQLVERRDLAAGQDVGAVGGGGHFAAKPKPLHEVIDVCQMIEDVSGPEHDKSPPRHATKQLEQAAIARSIDAGRPCDRDGEPRARGCLTRDALSFDLGLLINIAGPQRCVFIRGRMLDVAVHAHRAAMHHPCARRPPRRRQSDRQRRWR